MYGRLKLIAIWQRYEHSFATRFIDSVTVYNQHVVGVPSSGGQNDDDCCHAVE